MVSKTSRNRSGSVTLAMVTITTCSYTSWTVAPIGTVQPPLRLRASARQRPEEDPRRDRWDLSFGYAPSLEGLKRHVRDTHGADGSAAHFAVGSLVDDYLDLPQLLRRSPGQENTAMMYNAKT